MTNKFLAQSSTEIKASKRQFRGSFLPLFVVDNQRCVLAVFSRE